MSLTKSHPPPLPKQHALAKMSDLLMKFASHKIMTRNELDEELNKCCATYHHPFGKDAEPGKRRGGSYRIPGQGTFFHTEEFEACRFCGADLALNFDKSSRE
jgi:hypothetical protein